MPTKTRAARDAENALVAVQAEADAAGISVKEYLAALSTEKKAATNPKERVWPAQSKRHHGKKKRISESPEPTPASKSSKKAKADTADDEEELSDQGCNVLDGKDAVYHYSSDEDDEDENAMFEAQFRTKKTPKSKKQNPTDGELILQLMAQGDKKQAKKRCFWQPRRWSAQRSSGTRSSSMTRRTRRWPLILS
jgi:hypothetical protein